MLPQMTPLKCTQNTLFHIDYGVPLLARKSTDYRTSSAKNHGFMPNIPQYFDCRAEAKIKPNLLDRDVALRDECNTTYNKDFTEKHLDALTFQDERAINCGLLNYVQTAQEKIFANPPPPKPPKISEMKESYPLHYKAPSRDRCVNYSCKMPDTYRAMQPFIDPAATGSQKLLDIYLTENRLKYVRYTEEQVTKAQEDFITFYNANGKHKGLKEELPGNLHGRKNMYDKSLFASEHPNRILSRAPHKVPHLGMISEYQSNYPKPSCLEFYPYIQDSAVYFPESLSKSGPWQNLCPPAMYCTESCHIGTGWPIRCVVDVNSPVAENIKNKVCQ